MSTKQAPTLALHTATCTYLLDDGGICRSVMASSGVVPGHIRDCIGAQFVACLDLRVEGGLVGELCVGAMALFVRHRDPARLMLLRTGKITRVDDRTFFDAQEPPTPASVLQPQSHPEQNYGRVELPPPTAPPRFGRLRDAGEECTVTVNVEALGAAALGPAVVDPEDTAKVPKF